ncbi:MAG: hypothetical protein O7B26_03715 [Planctomycetota bacterium]|nr:hypothetical protein [Planctomycetota bacterium]
MIRNPIINRTPVQSILAVALAVLMTSCTPTALLNISAPTSVFGPAGVPVPRGYQVSFINNTAFRAIFTSGAYDPLDKNTSPINFGQLRLEGASTSGQLTQPCRKTFSVGGAELIRLITVTDLPVNDPRALINGVNFSGAPLGDPLEAEPTEGTALGLTILAGVDFNCMGIMLFTFEQDATAPGGFRIDFSFLPN